MSTTENRSSLGLFTSLSVMMFFVFFVWGAWYVTMGSFMDAQGLSDFKGNAYSVAPIAAIITPFFMGFFADRFINAEKLQAVLLFLSGILICIAPHFAAPETHSIFIGILLAHTLFFMPTLGLSNTICLKHLANPERDYPIVRVFATLGWIVAGLVVSFIFKAETSAAQFYIAGLVAFGVGIYSFFLPKTPPPSKGKAVRVGALIGADTLPYFKKFSFALFIIISLLVSVSMMPYWALGGSYAIELGIERFGGFFTLGQIAELFVLALVLPFFIKKFGIKWTMIVGITCWIVRFTLFSSAAGTTGSTMWVLMTSAVLLHGFSYDFVFISGYLYVDKHVSEDIRAQAQGLLVVVTQGLGFFLSSQIFINRVLPAVKVEGDSMASWKTFWMTPVWYLIPVLIIFVLLFREKKPISQAIVNETRSDT